MHIHSPLTAWELERLARRDAAAQNPSVHAVTTVICFTLTVSVAALIAVLVGTLIYVVVGAFRSVGVHLYAAILGFTMWIASYRLLMWGAAHPETILKSIPAVGDVTVTDPVNRR